MRYLLFLASALAFLVPQSARAGDAKATPEAPKLVRKFDDESLLKFLSGKGYADAKKLSDGLLRYTVMEGNIKVLVNVGKEGGDLRLFSIWTGKGVTLRMINDWNRDKRYTRAYQDEERDVVLDADFLFKEGVTKETLEHWLDVYEVSAIAFGKHMAGLVDEDNK